MTPRLGLGPNAGVGAREREREFLESLRSPDPPETRQGVGGWGLGGWDEGISAREKDDDDDDEQTDLEQAQVRASRCCCSFSWSLMHGIRPQQSLLRIKEMALISDPSAPSDYNIVT